MKSPRGRPAGREGHSIDVNRPLDASEMTSLRRDGRPSVLDPPRWPGKNDYPSPRALEWDMRDRLLDGMIGAHGPKGRADIHPMSVFNPERPPVRVY